MKSLAIKLVTGVATIGSLGGGIAYGIHKYNDTTNSVENYLKNSNLTPVASSEAAFWTKVLETYKLEKNEETSIQSTDVTKSDEIKNWCTENLKKDIKSKEDPLFKKASKWCVQYKTIKEELGSDKFETVAKTLATKYEGLDPSIKANVDKIEITPKTEENGEKIKKWCDENSYRSSSKENNSHTQNIRKICLKTSTG